MSCPVPTFADRSRAPNKTLCLPTRLERPSVILAVAPDFPAFERDHWVDVTNAVRPS
jgi:hypothetical protein